MQLTARDFEVTRLGQANVATQEIVGLKHLRGRWVNDEERIPLDIVWRPGQPPVGDLAFERAGPRRQLYFHPSTVKAGIVTCGGICPGLNDVIRALFMSLHYNYEVEEVLGFRFGFRGLDPARNLEPLNLTKNLVEQIHTTGGTILGTARGQVPAPDMVSRLRELGVNMLFVIGGDGTQRGAHAIAAAARELGYSLAVVGVPKTIDNDIDFLDRTFGLDSAVAFAQETLNAAHTEATDNYNGIGLVKLMGRNSGFIAALATLASINVNYVLVPELPFSMDGPKGLLTHLQRRISDPSTHHALIVVAEGAGQHLIGGERQHDMSGNAQHKDIGVYLKQRINEHFTAVGMEVNVKYFDPSYMLRSLPCNANDSIFAASLAQYAVHAAMSGRTDLMIGQRSNNFIHVPLSLATAERKVIDPKGELWLRVLQATGQPTHFS